jgi:outer membrane protein assembly factor BamB
VKIQMKKSALRFSISVGCSMAVGLLITGCASVSGLLGSAREARSVSIESRWTRSTLNRDFLGYRRLNRMAPLVLDKLVIQSNAVDGIVAYSRESGRQIWRMNVENGAEGGATVAGDRVYFGSSNGQFYCVNVADGKIVWEIPVRAETLAAPSIESGIVYFQNGADVVYAVDAGTGKQLWVFNRQTTGQLSIRATTRPTVAGDHVYVGFSDGFIVALKKRDGSLAWERKIGKGNRFNDVDSTPVIDGQSLYVASFDGTLMSLDKDSGNVNWQVEEGAYVPVTLGQERWSDRLYYATASGMLLSLDKKSGKQIASIRIPKGIPSQPTIFKGFVLYGESEGAFVVADAETLAPIQKFEPGHGLVARPTAIEATGEAYFISNSANLYAVKLGYRRNADRLPWQSL